MVKKTASKKTPAPAPAPVPEPTPEPKVVQNNDVSTVETLFKEVLADLAEEKAKIMATINKVKQLQKDWAKEQKNNKNKKKKGGDPAKKRDPSGFAKPTKISKELCDFLGCPEGKEMARTEVTKYLTEYIRNHNLQWEKDKRKIVPDKKLSKLLSCTKEDEVTYFNLQKWMKPHFSKQESSVSK